MKQEVLTLNIDGTRGTWYHNLDTGACVLIRELPPLVKKARRSSKNSKKNVETA